MSSVPHEIESAVAACVAGSLTAAQVKPVLAPFGIYEQRNGKFMLRVRITGGHLETGALRGLAGIMDRHRIPLGHLSSRQAIQLHDVEACEIPGVMEACRLIGLPFKGGGGNTYRNIMASPASGLASGEGFDVLPYALALNRAFAARPEALELPRKFKVGFFTGPGEEFMAAVQDLGFLAVCRGDRKGFVVYGGGGLGRESGLGVKLFDFLPHDQFIRCALAMLHLFNEQGDRGNRHQARLRFVLKSRGAERFARLCHFYFEKTPWESPALPSPPDCSMQARGPRSAGAAIRPEAGFEAWRAHATGPTALAADLVTVRLYVPYGNLAPEQFRRLAVLADDFGAGFLRLMRSQDLLLAPVFAAALPALHRRLLADFPGLDLTLRSFRGHIMTCVGSSTCKIGILPAPQLADAIADRLDPLLPADTPGKLAMLRRITDDLRISGCPNSCAAHPAAWLGFQGLRRKIGDTVQEAVLPFTGRCTRPDFFRLSTGSAADSAIPSDRLPAFVAEAVGPGRV